MGILFRTIGQSGSREAEVILNANLESSMITRIPLLLKVLPVKLQLTYLNVLVVDTEVSVPNFLINAQLVFNKPSANAIQTYRKGLAITANTTSSSEHGM